MANEAHLARLKQKQGVKVWNVWRREAPTIQPDLCRADLRGVHLAGADLCRADLIGANLSWVDLQEANVTGAHLQGVDLTGADLTRADLQWANLRGADMTRAHLTRTHLAGADLRMADFTDADLTGARLTNADLTGAHLTRTCLSRAILSRVKMGGTALAAVDLRMVQGLDTISHRGPSTIGIDTLYHSQGHIPEAFLRGAGVPDDMITYSKSLVGQPFQYHSCFISYSNRDKALAQRLHADLQDKGVRCWFAPEDVKIGHEFRSRLDESIQVYDRLLLILSESSVKSRWVQKEVETAFEKEVQENRMVMFPIRIDEAVMNSAVGWAADIRRQRHIGDFRQWKDHDAYQKAFQRLLHDLKGRHLTLARIAQIGPIPTITSLAAQ